MDNNEERRANGGSTETSPLLGKQKPVPGIEPTGGVAPVADTSAEGAGEVIDIHANGDALERQTSTEDRQKQYEGMPEVRKQFKYIIPALAIGVFLGAADQTIIVSSYGKIGSDLGALNLTSWIATAYFLTLTSFQPLYGKLSDIFGRKPCLLFAYTVFGLGCLFCGTAQDMNQLIAARAFAGIGGGGMNVVVSVLLSDVVPLRDRGTWQGYINIVFATGAASGAPLGGLLADTIGWRWAFLIQAPMCAVAFTAVTFALKLPKQDETDWKKKLGRIDFLGAAILLAAVFLLCLALDRGSNVSWSSTLTIVSLSISIPLFVVFVLVEMKIAKEPFAPGHIIFDRSMIACYLCNFFSMAGYIAALFYIPLYFQAIDDLTAAGAGVRLVPGIMCTVVGSLGGGIYMKKTGKFYWVTVWCYLLLTVGTLGIFLFSGIITNSTVGIILTMMVAAFGNGIGVTTTLIGLIANATRDDQAVATACSYLFRSLGSVFGISVSATVANQALRKNLAAELPSLGLPESKALEIAERVRQSLAYLRKLEPEVRAIVVDCYTKSTSAAFALQVALVAGAFISAWFIREKALSK
jgi:MFS family permease